MQAFLLAGFINLAAGALPDKATLKSIFIDGTGTKSPNFLTQAQIDSIDRELTMEFDQPAFTMGSAMPSPFNETCGMPTISCPAQKFNVMPGMETSTIAVRGVAMTSASDYTASVGPTITFDMNAGKKYTFTMVDGFSSASFYASGLAAVAQQYMHYSVLNMDQSSGLSAALKTTYAPPGNQIANIPNIYAFMVWEHTQNATQPGPIGVMNSELTIQKWLQAAGIADATLVAMNYLKVYGNVYTRATLLSGSYASMALDCTTGNFSSANKMCMSHSSTTGTTSGTTGTNTGTAGTTDGSATASGASVTSPKLSLIFGIALAVAIARH